MQTPRNPKTFCLTYSSNLVTLVCLQKQLIIHVLEIQVIFTKKALRLTCDNSQLTYLFRSPSDMGAADNLRVNSNK